MTIAAGTSLDSLPQHIVLEGMSWDFYEQLLSEIGNGATPVSYDEGRLEILSPLPKHEMWGGWMGRLIEMMCFQLAVLPEFRPWVKGL